MTSNFTLFSADNSLKNVTVLVLVGDFKADCLKHQ